MATNPNQELVKALFGLLLKEQPTRNALAQVIDDFRAAPARAAQFAEWLRGEASPPAILPLEMAHVTAFFDELNKVSDSVDFTRLLMKLLKEAFF